MGAQLASLFENVGKEMGPVGRMRVAMLTKITAFEAGELADSPANIALVTNAIAQIRKG